MAETNKISIPIDLETAAALRELAQFRREMVASKADGKDAGDQVGGAFRGAAGEIRNLFTAMLGIGSVTAVVMTAINQIKAEYQHLLQRQRDAMQEFVTEEPLRRRAMAAGISTGVGAADVQGIVARMMAAAPGGGLISDEAMRAVAPALRARGPMGVPQMESALNLAVRLRGQGDIGTIAAGTMAVMQAGGMGAEQAVEYGMRVAVPLTELGTLAPLLSSAAEMGFSPQEAGALYRYMMLSTGGDTGTALVATLEMMRRVSMARDPKQAKGLGLRRPIRGAGLAGISEFQAAFAAMPQVKQEELLAQIPGARGAARPAMQALFGGAPAARARLGEGMGAFAPGAPGMLQQYMAADVQGLGAELVQGQLTGEKTVEDLREAYPRGARITAARDRLWNALEASPISVFSRKLAMVNFERQMWIGLEPEAVAADILYYFAGYRDVPQGAPMERGGRILTRIQNIMEREAGSIAATSQPTTINNVTNQYNQPQTNTALNTTTRPSQ